MLVVSYASAWVVDRLLLSLEAVVPGMPVAIREHADAGAFAELVSVARRYPGPIRCHHDPANPGFGAGCNALARDSHARWLVFLNPDTELVTWPWSEHDPPADSIVGALVLGSRDPGEHWGTTFRVRDEIARSWLRHRGSKPMGVGFVSGAAMLIESGAFARLDGFDERYFLFYEDIDLCMRGNAAGVPTMVEERWQVRHSRAHSTRPMFASALEWSYESACLFHAAQHSNVSIYRGYVAIDSATRWLFHRLRGDRPRAAAYAQLARHVAADLTQRLLPNMRRRSRDRPRERPGG